MQAKLSAVTFSLAASPTRTLIVHSPYARSSCTRPVWRIGQAIAVIPSATISSPSLKDSHGQASDLKAREKPDLNSNED